MSIKTQSSNQSLLENISINYNKTKDIKKVLELANKQINEKRILEVEIFGKAISLNLDEKDIRNAIIFLRKIDKIK